MPEVSAHPLDVERPEWGKVFVVPWDTEIFGFPVGTYEPGEPSALQADLEALGQRLRAWTSTHRVELVSCTVPADDRIWRAVMPALGFLCVEQTLDVAYRIQTYDAAPPSRPVRLATADDRPQIEEIAGHTFHHGRYSADPRFRRTWRIGATATGSGARAPRRARRTACTSSASRATSRDSSS